MDTTTLEMRAEPAGAWTGRRDAVGLVAFSHAQAAPGRFGGASPEPTPTWRAVAYLADPSVVDGPSTLFDQKLLAEVRAGTMPAVITRLYVDSGRPDGDAAFGPALGRLLADARSGAFDAVVVEHVSRFAPDYLDALGAAVALGRAGIEVVEARGGPVAVESAVAELIEGAL